MNVLESHFGFFQTCFRGLSIVRGRFRGLSGGKQCPRDGRHCGFPPFFEIHPAKLLGWILHTVIVDRWFSKHSVFSFIFHSIYHRERVDVVINRSVQPLNRHLNVFMWKSGCDYVEIRRHNWQSIWEHLRSHPKIPNDSLIQLLFVATGPVSSAVFFSFCFHLQLNISNNHGS